MHDDEALTIALVLVASFDIYFLYRNKNLIRREEKRYKTNLLEKP